MVCGPMIDTEFSQTGVPTSKGTPTYYSAKFLQIVFKNKENWAEGGTHLLYPDSEPIQNV